MSRRRSVRWLSASGAVLVGSVLLAAWGAMADPVVTGVSADDTTITDADASNSFTVAVDFDAAMNTSIAPALTFDPDVSSTLTSTGGTWMDGDRYVATYAVSDANVDVDSVTVDVTDAWDLAGTPQQDYTPTAEFEVDTLNPTAPSVPDLRWGSDLGVSSADDITRDSTPVFDGSAESNTTVEVRSSVSGSLGTTTAPGGAWTFTVADRAPLSDGVHDISARATDGVGNVGPWSPGLDVLIDTQVPPAPGGRSPADGARMEDNTPTFSWAASTDPGGSGIRDYRICLAGPSSRDYYTTRTSYTPTALDDGSYTWHICARDVAGNTGPRSATWGLDIGPQNPTVTVNIVEESLYDGNNSSQITFTFSEAVTDFAAVDDLTVVGGAVSDFSGSGTSYAAAFTATDGVDVTGSTTVNAESYADAAGNPGAGGSDTVDIDTQNPTVTAVVAGNLLISDDDALGLFPVTVDFSEAMSPGSTPTLVFSPSVATTLAFSAGGWVDGDTYQAIYSVTDACVSQSSVTVDVLNAKDSAGNDQQDYSAAHRFQVDTANPSVSAVVADAPLVFDGDPTQQVTVAFNEAMDTAATPTITFSVGTWTGGPAGTWSSGNTVWMKPFTLVDNNQTVADVTVGVSGAQDAAGNAQEEYAPEPGFSIDTRNPLAAVTTDHTETADGSPIYEGSLVLTVTVTYDEIMDISTVPAIVLEDGGPHWGRQVSLGWTEDRVYRAAFTHDGAEEPTPPAGPVSAFARVSDASGATDLAGNSDVGGDSPVFQIDTRKPETAPGVLAVMIDTDPVYESDLTQQVTVTFDEAMDTSVAPTIAFSAGTWTPGAAGVWNSTTEWMQTYTVTDNDQEVSGVTIDVSGAQDAAGNAQENHVPAGEFDLDTRSPQATTTTDHTNIVAGSPIYEGSLVLTVTVTYNEAMNTSTEPSVTLENEGAHWGGQVSLGWTGSTVYQATFTHDGTEEPMPPTGPISALARVATASGATDLAGNVDVGDDSPAFRIDTRRPCATVTTDHTTIADGSPIYENSLVLTVTVTYDEAMDPTTTPNITLEDEGSHWDGQISLGWTGSTVYRATFTHDGTEGPTPPAGALSAFARVSDASGATDLAGNTDVGDDSPSFEIDTRKPETAPGVTAIEIDTDPVFEGDLVQRVTLTFDEAMRSDGTADPTISFNHGTWTTNGDGAWNSPVDTVWTEAFTLTDNDEEFYDRAAGASVVTVSASGTRDVAGNEQEPYAAETEFDIDTLQPGIAQFTSVPDSGCCVAGDTIDITVLFSESVFGDLTLNLNSRGSVDVLGVRDSTTETRAYTIQAEENSCGLDIASAVVDACGSLVDWAGNSAHWTDKETNLTLPSDGSLANHSDVIVDTTVPTTVDDPNEDAGRYDADSNIVEARLDSQGQWRLMLRQDTPVYIDVLANDIELPCVSHLSIYDFPVPPIHGTIPENAPTGSVRYAPFSGHVGPDSFTYRAIDACGNISEQTTVYVEVIPKLLLRDAYVTACAEATTEVAVTARDLFLAPGEPEDAEFSLEVIEGPEHGILAGDLTDIEPEGPGPSTLFIESFTMSLVYSPAAGFIGRDRFLVRLTDPYGDMTTATVDIEVCGCPRVKRPSLVLSAGDLLPLIVPISFASDCAESWDTVILRDELGVAHSDALLAAWSGTLRRCILTVDTTRLPLGTYTLVVPLGKDGIVTLDLIVGE